MDYIKTDNSKSSCYQCCFDTVEHLLNLICASYYSTVISADMRAFDVRKITKVEWLADSETYNVLIGSRGIDYYILY